MTATTDLPPILTPRTLEALRPYLAADVVDGLRQSLRAFFATSIEPLYASSAIDFDAALLRAVPDAAKPRTELVLSFLRALEPTLCGEAFREGFGVARDSLEQEGWRLGDAIEALQLAFDELRSMVPDGAPSAEALPPPDLTGSDLDQVPAAVREALESMLLRAVEIDLCVLGPLAYLQGDLPTADPSRVRRGCEIAAIAASMVCARYTGLSRPDLTATERGAVLHALAGSWSHSEEHDRALDRIYDDRTRDR